MSTSRRQSKRRTDKLAGSKLVQGQWGTIVFEVRVVACRAVHMITEMLSGYGPLIRTYVQFILAKLRFHRIRPEFNGLFEYEEYVTLKGIDDPNEG